MHDTVSKVSFERHALAWRFALNSYSTLAPAWKSCNMSLNAFYTDQQTAKVY